MDWSLCWRRKSLCSAIPLKICSLAQVHILSLTIVGQFTESIQNEIFFREIRGVILEKVCQYLVYKNKYQNSTTEIPEFVIEPDIALELMMAADFLDT